MTIAIMILVLVNTAAVAYLATVIFEIRDGVQSYYPSLVKIMAEQRDVLQSTLDSINGWSDLSSDIIAHIERVEDMEGDIKDIFEWIHSVDNNVADMRRDIQDTDTKLISLMAAYDRNALMFFNDLQSLQKDIREIKEKSPEKYGWDDWNNIRVDAADHGDTDGDISIVRYPSIQTDLVNLKKGDNNA